MIDEKFRLSDVAHHVNKTVGMAVIPTPDGKYQVFDPDNDEDRSKFFMSLEEILDYVEEIQNQKYLRTSKVIKEGYLLPYHDDEEVVFETRLTDTYEQNRVVAAFRRNVKSFKYLGIKFHVCEGHLFEDVGISCSSREFVSAFYVDNNGEIRSEKFVYPRFLSFEDIKRR